MPGREWLASFLQRRLIYRSATVGCECVRFSVLASFLGKWSVVRLGTRKPPAARSRGPRWPRGRSRFPSEPECPRPAPPRRLRSRPFPGGRRPTPAHGRVLSRSRTLPTHPGAARGRGTGGRAGPGPWSQPAESSRQPRAPPTEHCRTAGGAAAERAEAAAAGPGLLRPAAGGGWPARGWGCAGTPQEGPQQASRWPAPAGRGMGQTLHQGGECRGKGEPRRESRTLPGGQHTLATTSTEARMNLKCLPLV